MQPVKPFKKNFHLAKRCKLAKISKLIENYPKKYPTPKYLIFIERMLKNGWYVKMYVANRVSKYVFIEKEDKFFKIRFSNHKPLFGKELENDCDFYVGVSHTQVKTTEQLISLLEN